MSDPDVSGPILRASRSGNVRRMFELLADFRPSRVAYAVTGVCAIIGSLCEAAVLILVTLSAANLAEDQPGTEVLDRLNLGPGELLLVAFGLLLCRFGFGFVANDRVGRLGADVLLAARHRMLSVFANAEWERQARHEPGLLYDLLTNRADVVGYSAILVCSVIVATANLVILGLAALALSPLAVLCLASMGLASLWVLRPIARRTRAVAMAYLVENERLVKSVTDLNLNARDLKAFGTSEALIERIDAQQLEAAALYRRRHLLAQLTPNAYQTFGLGLAIAALAIAHRWSGGNLAALGAVVLLMLRGVSYGQNLMSSAQAINDRVPFVASFVEAIDDFEAHAAIRGELRSVPPLQIELQAVRYRYNGADDDALKAISVVIEPGQRIGIVGASGGGKTTLLQVMAGLRVPASGEFLVNGLSQKDLDPRWWSKVCAFVPQDPRLLGATMSENVTLLRDLSASDVDLALSSAQLDVDLESLGGVEASLAPDIRSLSGGQLQRVAIARALAGRPDLLLMDEPTSALDIGTESRLQAALGELQGQVTMVIVAHRLSTVATCDRVLVLEGGRLVSDGPPEQILSKFGDVALSDWEIET